MFNWWTHDNEFCNPVYSFPVSCIDIFMSPGAIVENNEIHGAGYAAIYGEGGAGQIIRNNFVENARASSPGAWGGFAVMASNQKAKGPGTGMKIYGNHFVNCGNGPFLEGYASAQIYNNIMEDMQRNGIELAPKDDGNVFSDGALVAANHILGFGKVSTGRGIMLNQVNNCDVGPNAAGAAQNVIDGKGYAGASEGIGETTGSHAGRPDYNHVHSNSITGCKNAWVKKGAHSLFE